MEKIEEKLREIKKRGKIGLMTHVVIGYPTIDDTVKLVRLMEKSRVDIVELQIPFSDPLADGPTIMRACEEALRNGTKVKDAFAVMKKLSLQVDMPLLFMAYYNTVFNYGVEKFCKDAIEAGCQGLIVPDIPIEEEENEHFIEMCKKYDLANIRVVSPSSTDERLKKNSDVGTGFIYCTARQGITGAKDTLDPEIVDFLKRVKRYFKIPITVGFGISKKEHTELLKEHADIAVVGSALIDVFNESKNKNYEKSVSEFLERMIN